MMFKLGEKVIIIVFDSYCIDYKGKIGKIVMVDRIKRGFSSRWDYDVTFDDGFTYPFASDEIKGAANEQLEFDFMQR